MPGPVYITPPVNAAQAIFRRISALIVPRLATTDITPNQVTVARGVVVLVALGLFAYGTPVSFLAGAILFYLFEVLDHVDGDLARHTGKLTQAGPLLEQFIDTWGSRPSNLFGLAIAVGMYRLDGTLTGPVLFALTVFGRLSWLEYRDHFGWDRGAAAESGEYLSVFGADGPRETAINLLKLLYIWNNTFLLLAALLYMPLHAWTGVNFLVPAFIVVAIINNLPWIGLVTKGFVDAMARPDK